MIISQYATPVRPARGLLAPAPRTELADSFEVSPVLLASGVTGLTTGGACAVIAGLSLAQTAQVVGVGALVGLSFGLAAALLHIPKQPAVLPLEPAVKPESPDAALLVDSKESLSRLGTRRHLLESLVGAQQLVQKSSGHQGRDTEASVSSQLNQAAVEWGHFQAGRPEARAVESEPSKTELKEMLLELRGDEARVVDVNLRSEQLYKDSVGRLGLGPLNESKKLQADMRSEGQRLQKLIL